LLFGLLILTSYIQYRGWSKFLAWVRKRWSTNWIFNGSCWGLFLCKYYWHFILFLLCFIDFS